MSDPNNNLNIDPEQLEPERPNTLDHDSGIDEGEELSTSSVRTSVYAYPNLYG
jgi:hypothetical protein